MRSPGACERLVEFREVALAEELLVGCRVKVGGDHFQQEASPLLTGSNGCAYLARIRQFFHSGFLF